jgi:hypothetical protein
LALSESSALLPAVHAASNNASSKGSKRNEVPVVTRPAVMDCLSWRLCPLLFD